MNKSCIDLIVLERYEDACQFLEDQHDKQSYYLLSLLYRQLDSFIEERELVNRALLLDNNWQYMIDRKKWHELPDSRKMTARPPLRLERNAVDIPKPGTRETMCFVTGGDSHYYPVMRECVESIKATELYNNVPIYIIDCGLEDEERASLSKLLAGGAIKKSGWLIDFKEFHVLDKITGEPRCVTAVPDIYQLIANKAFLNKIFPGHDYYFWINANSWVQDERAIDAFLSITETQSMAYPDASHGNARLLEYAPTHRTNYIPRKYRTTAFKVRHGCDAVFCASEDMLHQCQILVQDFVTQNNGVYFYYFFELVQSFITAEQKLKPDVAIKHYAHFNHLVAPGSGYKPMIFADNPHVIYKQQCPNDPIGIIRPIGFHDYDHTLFIQNEKNEVIGNRNGSTRYRTYPLIEKTELRKQLLGAAKSIHAER